MHWIERDGQHQLIGDGRVLARITQDRDRWAVVLHGPMLWQVVRGEAASFAQGSKYAERWIGARALVSQTAPRRDPIQRAAVGAHRMANLDERSMRHAVESRVCVTHTHLVIAKAKVLELARTESQSAEIIGKVLEGMSLRESVKLTYSRSQAADQSPDLQRVSDGLLWRRATGEAIWGLIHDGILLPTKCELTGGSKSVGYFIGEDGNGHSSSFDIAVVPVPHGVMIAPSFSYDERGVLSSGDLFLAHLDCPEMHAEIASAIGEAVDCLRREYLSASVALLGKASEGAWLELGSALVSAFPAANITSIKKQKEALESPFPGVMQKIDAVRAIYVHGLMESVRNLAGVQPRDLELSVLWSDQVRGSRNTIHFGSVPSTPLNFENVALLFMGALPALRMLYRIRAAAS